MQDLAEEDLAPKDIVVQLRDRNGKHYGRLLGFAHVVLRRTLEDLARENSNALTTFRQFTDKGMYFLVAVQQSRCQTQEDMDMKFIGAHLCKHLASFLVLNYYLSFFGP